MCGVFGFVTKNGNGPDLHRLRVLALAAEQRGAHAFGFAWVDQDGGIHCRKYIGPARKHLGTLDQVADARIVIGHTRYATHGAWDDNANNHPHRAGDGWVVHNGVVTNHVELAAYRRIKLTTDCDSEVLGRMLAKVSSDPQRAAKKAAEVAHAAHGRHVILGLWTNPQRLLIVRKQNPLYTGDAARGTYLCSFATGLPKNARAARDYATFLIGLSDSGEWATGRAAIERPPVSRVDDNWQRAFTWGNWAGDLSETSEYRGG